MTHHDRGPSVRRESLPRRVAALANRARQLAITRQVRAARGFHFLHDQGALSIDHRSDLVSEPADEWIDLDSHVFGRRADPQVGGRVEQPKSDMMAEQGVWACLLECQILRPT